MSSTFSKSSQASSDDPDTRLSLIEQAKKDIPSAWEIVYTVYTPLIRRWAKGNGVTCPFELENVTQEVFAKLAKNLKQYQDRADGGSFRGWLRVITRNHIFTNHLGDSSLKTVGGSEWHRRVNEIPFDNEAINSLLDSVSSAKPDEKSLIFSKIVAYVDFRFRKQKRQRIVFRRVILEEHSPSEVAKDLGVSVNVIYQLKSRILAQIREFFKDLV